MNNDTNAALWLLVPLGMVLVCVWYFWPSEPKLQSPDGNIVIHTECVQQGQSFFKFTVPGTSTPDSEYSCTEQEKLIAANKAKAARLYKQWCAAQLPTTMTFEEYTKCYENN